MPETMITYRDDRRPTTETIIALYRAAALERPVDDRERIAQMYTGSNMVLTAWDGEELVGILRAWSDGSFFGYIADLAVHPTCQRQGVGRELLRRAIASNTQVTFFLNAAPEAKEYYQHVGWQAVTNGWVWRRKG